MKLTQRSQANSVSLNNTIIYVVNTTDTSQSASGSSYYATLQQVVDILPKDIDITITGGTYSNGTLTLNNNTGGTININGFTSQEIFVTGATANNNGKTYTFTNNTGGTFTLAALTDITITGGTYSNGTLSLINSTGGTISINGFSTGTSSTDTYVTGATTNNNNKTYVFNNNIGGSFTVNGLTDITITSGSYNSGTLTLNNSTGGTIVITGLTASAGTDTYITGATTNNGNKTYTFTSNSGNSFIVNGLTDITISNGTYSNGTLVLNNSTGGTINITGFTTGSTSGQEIFVTGATANNNNKTYTFTNNTGGTFTVVGLTDINTTGGTYSNGTITLTNNTGGTVVITGITASGSSSVLTAITLSMPASSVPAIQIETINSDGLNYIGGGVAANIIVNHANGNVLNATSTGQGITVDAYGQAANFYSKFNNAGVFTQTGALTGTNNADTVSINRNFVLYSGTTTAGTVVNYVASGSVLNINDATDANGHLLRISKKSVDKFIIKSGGTLQYIDGNQGLNKVLTSDLNGNATWQTISVSGGSSTDTYITGGTYLSGTITLRNNTGGTVVITGITASGASGTSYTFSTGLNNSGGTITNNLSTGVAFGQSVIGATTASDDLTLSSTAHATKGRIYFGSGSCFNEANQRLGLRTTNPAGVLDLYSTNGNDGLRLVNSTVTASASGSPVGHAFLQLTNGTGATNLALYDFNAAGTYARRVTFHGSTGNVTIGSGSSTHGLAKLSVEGTLRITDGTEGVGKILTSDETGIASWQTISLTGGSGIDTYVTGATFNNNNYTLYNNTGGTISTLINNLSGLTITGLSNSGTTRIVEASSGGTLSATKEIVEAVITSSGLTSQLQTAGNWTGAPPTLTATGATTGYQGQMYFGGITGTSYVFICKQDGIWVRSLLS